MFTNTKSPALVPVLLAVLVAAPAAAQSTVAQATVPVAAATHAQPALTSLVIAVGETKTGSLTDEDPRLDEGEHYHAYDFYGRAGQRIAVSLRSSSFDSYLAIITSDIEWENQDDDSGGDSNALLDVTLPVTGRYVIIVTTYEGDETGDYTLSVSALEANTARDTEEWVQYGQASDNDASLFYLPSSIRNTGDNILQVWTRWTYPGMQPPSTGDAQYDSEKRLVRVDCGGDALGLVSFVEYAGDTAVNNWTAKDVEMNPAVPGSVGSSLLDRVCSNRAP
ncbi:MAG TPA: surface-adhesin E family protein [Longimicrobiales bacterium]|nr:surface-adhesin E family protein [Longimicrobiales bacterium]